MSLPLESLLENRYLIKKTLGQGGMGAVYLAEDHRLEGRYVAIKEMHVHIGQGENYDKAIKQFKMEATMLARLDHPNLPKIIDYFEDGKKQYLVMEYITGKTLKELIEEEGQAFSEDQVINWGLPICSALSFLHNQDPPIVFRDLKPQNIMLNTNDQIKLIDFGIAKLFIPSEKTDTFISAKGSMGYCPPEQCSPKGKTDPRTDIYSLAATLHYLITNRNPSELPFVFPPVRELNSKASKEIEEIFSKALELDCEDRYTSVSDFKEDLEKLVSKKNVKLEDWVSKWWTGIALALAFYGAGLISIRSLVKNIKPFLTYLYKPVSFLLIFIYLFIPIAGLIWYLTQKKKDTKTEKLNKKVVE